MKAIVFDMDGVLYDTEKLCMDCWCQVAAKNHVKDMEIVFPKCIGTNSHDTLSIVMKHYGPDFPYETFRQEADRVMMEYIETRGLPMKKGVRELLDFLKKNKARVALASSSSRRTINWYLEITGLTDYFEVIVSGDMVKHSKPEPEIYLIACEQLGVEPQNAYAIEDSYNGIRSAYRAGMMPVMVPDMIAPDREMEEKALVILEDLLKVKDYLGEKEAWQI